MTTLENTIIELRKVHRLREDFMKLRISQNNQIKAIERKNKGVEFEVDPSEYFTEFEGISSGEKIYGKQLEKLAKELPHFTFVRDNIKGMSALSYGALIAETGDLRNYSNSSKVWKRMGLGVTNGRADKNRTKGINTGYSKHRRTIAHRMSEAIIKQSKDNPYRDIYDERKQYEIERDAVGYNKEYIINNASSLSMYSSPENQKKLKEYRLPQDVINKRALRYMIKRVFKDIWKQWNKPKKRRRRN